MSKLRFQSIATWIAQRTEVILSLLGFAALYLILALFSQGGPLSTDVIWYMNAGLNGIKDFFILNRYFHVFFEAVFLKTAPTPLVGLQHYWAFLIAGTCLLTYWSARQLSPHSRPWHGLLAASLFLTIREIAITSGMALVDTTAMFMVMLIVTVYIFSARSGHQMTWLVILTGFLFLLAFKTKETTLAASVLFIGYGFTPENHFDWKLFWKRVIYLLCGGAAGIIFFIFLNLVFLQDAWFGFRPGEITLFFQTYFDGAVNTPKHLGVDNWFTAYFLSNLWIPFLLYVVSSARTPIDNGIRSSIRIIWMVPLGIILIVSVTVGNQWGFLPRFVFPALPVICVLGPQFLSFDFKSANIKNKRFAVYIFCAGLVLMILLRFGLRYFLPEIGWDITTFLTLVYVPALLSIILATVVFQPGLSLPGSVFVSVLIIAILVIPGVMNVKQMLLYQPNLERTEKLFYPFFAFREQIHYTTDMSFYVSSDAWRELGLADYADDRNEVASLFNIYFDSSATGPQFIVSGEDPIRVEDLLRSKYTYALFSLENWRTLTLGTENMKLVEEKYQVHVDGKELTVLLKARD